MPAVLFSLLPLLAKIAPDLLGLAFGEGGATVANRVENAVRDIFGTTDADQVQAEAVADPSKAEALKARLDAETAQLRADLADKADARSATMALAKAGSPLALGSPVISTVVVTAFAAVAIVVFARYGVESAVGQLIAGALIAKFGTVVDYWLGSSKGSSDRAEQVAALLHQVIGGLSATAAVKGSRT